MVPPSKKKRRTKERLLLGKGVKGIEEDEIPDEHELRCAFPEMSTKLSNWMLHGQNLGSMLSDYCRQCRHMKKVKVVSWHILQYDLKHIGHDWFND